MATSVRLSMPPSCIESRQSAADPQESNALEGPGDDWVSLMLSDVELDMGAECSAPLAPLVGFPLPEFEDFDFANLDGSASSASVCHHTSSSSSSSGFDAIPYPFDEGQTASSAKQEVCFNPSEFVQENYPNLEDDHWVMDSKPDGLAHLHSQGATSGSINTSIQPAMPMDSDSSLISDHSLVHTDVKTQVTVKGVLPYSESPDSELTCGSTEYPVSGANIATMDSGSEDDNLLFLVSDICPEGTADTKFESGNSTVMCNIPTNVQDACMGTSQIKPGTSNCVDILQAGDSQQQLPCCPKTASSSKVSRKRKALDRKSRSSTPEDAVVNSTERFENAPKGSDLKDDDDDQKRQARLMRNRESAQLSRQRKKIYVDELEEKIKTMASTIAELNNTINLISAENINLRRQLGYFGPPPGQPGGMPGTAPWVAPYPGPMVGGRFAVPGSQVPLVAIPRWRSQQSTSTKSKKSKSEAQAKGREEKAPKRMKKLAGVAAVGLFFFLFLLFPFNLMFSVLKPGLIDESNVWAAGTWYTYPSSAMVKHGGRVLMGMEGEDNLVHDEPGTRWVSVSDDSRVAGKDTQTRSMSESWHPLTECQTGGTISDTQGRNASVPLAATLFVPKNDKLVKIDGNLVIHSVLAGERATRESLNQQKDIKSKRGRIIVSYDKGRALDANLKALAVKADPEEKGALVELQKALAANSNMELEGGGIQSVQDDGSLQQWFMEGLAGSVFRSGMCREVFHFETSPSASGPSGESVSHSSEGVELVKNSTGRLQDHGPQRARRWVTSRKGVSYAVPLPPIGHKEAYNGSFHNNSTAGAHDKFNSQRKFEKQKHTSSIVVSVLAGSELEDPPNLSGGAKGVSQIFVVVLIDSVKYATYSCMLPSTQSNPRYEVVVD